MAHRTVLGCSLFLLLINTGIGLAEAGDPFSGSTPELDTASEVVVEDGTGEWKVSERNGAVAYSVPIDVPPGRNGLAPSLSLRYSSDLPLRGGLAVGWTLDMPSIEADLSLGAAEGVHHKIALGAVAGRLVQVPDTSPYPRGNAYRVQFDNSSTRIFSIPASSTGPTAGGWVALSPDGVRHHFERREGAHSNGVWNLTREVDTFGNTVRYDWLALPKNDEIDLGHSLQAIEYTSNDNAGLLPHARIVFDYAPMELCAGSRIPIGAAYRRGSAQVTGSQPLRSIRVFVRETQASEWTLRKQIDLSYKLQNSVLYDDPAAVAPQGREGIAASVASGASERSIVAAGEADANRRREPQGRDRTRAGLARAGDPRTAAPGPLAPTAPSGPARTTRTCRQNPLRYLTRIDITALDRNGNATVLPPIELEYNARRDLSLPHSRLPGEAPMGETTVEIPGFAHEGRSGTRMGGLRTTLLDIDNDGIRDRVTVVEENRVCTLVWTRGRPGGSFEESERRAPLPTAAWYREWRGVPGPPEEGKEGCTLGGQIAYRLATEAFPSSGTSGKPMEATVAAKGVLSYHFMDYTGDGRLDLITSTWASSDCFWTYDPFANDKTDTPCSFGGEGPTSFVALESSSPLRPEKETEAGQGRSVWRLYRGTGLPDRPFQLHPRQKPTLIRSPVDLPPPASEDRLDLATKTHYSVPPLFDLDGDGFLDAIDTTETRRTSPCSDSLLQADGCDWTVYFGDGSETFPEISAAHVWDVPKATLASDNWSANPGCGDDFLLRRDTVIGLRDINGDGLADLVVRLSDRQLYSYRNTGSGFVGRRTEADGPELGSRLNARSALERAQTDCDGFILAGSLRNGHRGYQRRLVDLDADGLLDIVWFQGGPAITARGRVKAKFNLGDGFGDPVTLLFPEKWVRSQRLLAAEWKSDDFVGRWHLLNDFTDVDGDGLADLVRWHKPRPEAVSLGAAGSGQRVGPKPTMTYVRRPGLPVAPDLLRRVTNGRGMVLSFSYSPSTDRGVVDWDGRESTLPTPRWVVRQSTVEGGFGTPATITRYDYREPTYGSSDVHTGFRERSQLAGFAQNARTIDYANGTSQQVRQRYDYHGLQGDLASVRTFRDGRLHGVVRKEWLHESLFDNRIHLSLPTLTATCVTRPETASEAECFSRDDHVRRTEKTWQFSPDDRQFLNTRRREGLGNASDRRDRQTEIEYANLYGTASDPEDYRIRIGETRKTVGTNRGSVLVGRTVRRYDVATGLVAAVRKFSDEQTSVVTRYEYDPETGSLVSLQKPQQAHLDGPKTTYRHDSHRLFVAETSNELEQITKTAFDVATGVLTKREGPNFVSAGTTPIFETERWTVDGLGRVVSRSISIESQTLNNPGYEEKIIERFSYLDLPDPGNPVSVRSERLLDFDSTHFIPEVQEFDGLGRLLSDYEIFEGDMFERARYRYAESGGVESIEMVDPSDNSNRIEYSYRYDAVGRVTDFTRPDGTGNHITYVGQDQTVREVASDGSGGAKTRRFDAFGRLAELHEDALGADPAVTRYEYDVHDNLSQITDAEGNVTEIDHDFLGNRVEIVRGARRWRYRYDRNGNPLSKQSPVPAGADAAHYQTTFSYDELDRPTSQTYAHLRASSAPASASFPGGPETDALSTDMDTIRYHYDQAPNGIGRLHRVELPFGQIDYRYDTRGLITRERRDLQLNSPALSTSQHVDRRYNALGQLTRSRWHDGQEWRIRYDERGLVSTVDWLDPESSTWLSVAEYQRERTGLALTRHTSFGQTRTHTYDALARPLTDVVTLEGRPTSLAQRAYAYTGTGDLATVLGHTDGVSANALYGYDALHRLVSADGPHGYRGRFAYSATGNIRSAEVDWDDSPQSHHVHYAYGQLDPQAVDALHDATSGDAIAAFQYDAAGNMIWRSTPDGDQLLHWNGQDQLRRVDTEDGQETYFYDHLSQRALAVDAAGGVRLWFGEREIHFDPDGTEELTYLHLSAGGPTLARVKDRTDIELQYADALQNLMFSLDRSGTVTSSFLYGPFGEVVHAAGSAGHRRQFNGKESDAITGLRYYGYRYYDPQALLWTSPDPLALAIPEIGYDDAQKMHRYTFSFNNPSRFLDPDGLHPKPKGGTTTDSNGTTVEVECVDGTDDCFEAAENAALVKEAHRVFRELDVAAKQARREEKLASARFKELMYQCSQVGSSGCGEREPAREAWKSSKKAASRAFSRRVHFQTSNEHAPHHDYYSYQERTSYRAHKRRVWQRKRMLRQMALRPHVDPEWPTTRDVVWAAGLVANWAAIALPVGKAAQYGVWGVTGILGYLDW